MRLFEMKTLPETFGKAKIEYVKGKTAPYRDGRTIVIPSDGNTELFVLNRSQFLLHLPLSRSDWFGGTDENPFLVRLDEEPFRAFLEGGVLGDARFYAMLRWREAGLLALAVKRNVKRQGDIFAVPLNVAWGTLERCFRVASQGLEIAPCDGYSVFGTRHSLRGKAINHGGRVQVYGISTPFIGSGVLSAPDHSNLDLGDKPHALYQTAHLYDPTRAD